MSVVLESEAVQHVNVTLLQLTKELAAEVDVPSLAAQVSRRLQWLLHAATVNFFLVDHTSGHLCWLQPLPPRSPLGSAAPVAVPIKLPLKHGIVGWAAHLGTPLVVSNAHTHPHFDFTVDQCDVTRPECAGGPTPGGGGGVPGTSPSHEDSEAGALPPPAPASPASLPCSVLPLQPA